MNVSEAQSILGVSSTASSGEIKTAFKKKAAKLHPDVNKAENAEDEFKKLNEAFQLLTNPPAPPMGVYSDPIFTQEFFTGFQTVFGKSSNNIKARISISLEEAVKGTKKDISFTRSARCSKCKQGLVVENKQTKTCSHCRGSGTAKETYSAKVTIPPRFIGGALCLNKQGDYIHIFNIHTDAFVFVTIEKDPSGELIVENGAVLSILKLTLLEALKGCNKKVKTILGQRTLKIPGPVHNGDKVVSQGLGLAKNKSHTFLINIVYPDNLDGIINFLEGSEEQDGYIDNESKE